jgi:uncharacterized cupredoxin-like copper-binding protein
MEIIMGKKISIASCIIALAFLAVPAAPAFADATVNVSLLDKGGAMDLSKNMMMGMGVKANMKKAIMSIKIDKKTVPAGNVTFKVKNASRETLHEMLVAPIASEATVLPFIEAENRVDEEKSGGLGEVSELEPGKSGALTLELKPGLYILYCNVPGHYTAGMWTVLKVT